MEYPPGFELHDDTLIHVGYDHASIIGSMRPDKAYPDRKIRRARKTVSTVTAQLCPCPDEHVEVWVRRVG